MDDGSIRPGRRNGVEGETDKVLVSPVMCD